MTLKYVRPWKLCLFLIISILDSLQPVFLAYMLKLFIAFAQKPHGSLLNLTALAISGLLLFGVIGILFQYSFLNIIHDANLKIKELSANYLVKCRSSQQIIDSSFMTNDLKQIETGRVVSELKIINYVLKFLSAVILALIASWIISLIFFVAALIPALVQNAAAKKISSSAKNWEEANSYYTNTVNETIAGTNIAALYDIQNSFIGRLIKAAKAMEHALQTTSLAKGIANEFTSVAAYCFGMMIPFSFGIYFISIGNITLSTFMMIVQLSNNFINPVVNIFMCINDIKTTTPIWQKFQAIANFKPKKQTTKIPATAFRLLSLKNAGIKLNNQQIFSNVSLAVKSGEKILLQAPSGWGKSTLLNVLTGNYQVSSGSYEINGQNASGDWQHDHEFFSFIQQKPFILDDTLKYNITLGREVAETKLNQVASQAGLSDLVKQKGWDYRVGPDGQNLSGGQNQRIEIARALLADRPILLADEATSSLDQDLSQKIHQAILTDFPGTVIEVAHHIAPNEQKLFNRVIKLE